MAPSPISSQKGVTDSLEISSEGCTSPVPPKSPLPCCASPPPLSEWPLQEGSPSRANTQLVAGPHHQRDTVWEGVQPTDLGPLGSTAAPQPAGAQPEPLQRGSFMHGMTPDVAFALILVGFTLVPLPSLSQALCRAALPAVTSHPQSPWACSTPLPCLQIRTLNIPRSGASTQLRPGLCASDGTAQCQAVQGALCPPAGLPNIQTSAPNMHPNSCSSAWLGGHYMSVSVYNSQVLVRVWALSAPWQRHWGVRSGIYTASVDVKQQDAPAAQSECAQGGAAAGDTSHCQEGSPHRGRSLLCAEEGPCCGWAGRAARAAAVSPAWGCATHSRAQPASQHRFGLSGFCF